MACTLEQHVVRDLRLQNLQKQHPVWLLPWWEQHVVINTKMHTLHLPKHSISHLHQNLCTKQHKDAQFTKNRTPSMTSGCIRQHGLSTEGGGNTDTPYHIPLTPDNIDWVLRVKIMQTHHILLLHAHLCQDKKDTRLCQDKDTLHAVSGQQEQPSASGKWHPSVSGQHGPKEMGRTLTSYMEGKSCMIGSK